MKQSTLNQRTITNSVDDYIDICSWQLKDVPQFFIEKDPQSFFKMNRLEKISFLFEWNRMSEKLFSDVFLHIPLNKQNYRTFVKILKSNIFNSYRIFLIGLAHQYMIKYNLSVSGMVRLDKYYII